MSEQAIKHAGPRAVNNPACRDNYPPELMALWWDVPADHVELCREVGFGIRGSMEGRTRSRKLRQSPTDLTDWESRFHGLTHPSCEAWRYHVRLSQIALAFAWHADEYMRRTA